MDQIPVIPTSNRLGIDKYRCSVASLGSLARLQQINNGTGIFMFSGISVCIMYVYYVSNRPALALAMWANFMIF